MAWLVGRLRKFPGANATARGRPAAAFYAWHQGAMPGRRPAHAQSAAHNGRYGLFIHIARKFDHDWHAQV